MQKPHALTDEALRAFSEAADPAALEATRVAWLGKQGRLTTELKALGRLPPEQRRDQGAALNDLKKVLQGALSDRRTVLEGEQLSARLRDENIDISLPGRGAGRGAEHPIELALDRIIGIFAAMGYAVADGPEVEDDWHNFEALNFPADHPARAMHDTFYLPSGHLLRTHTSPVQIRALAEATPPIKLIAPGRVYRSDSDQTHSPMFHQVEGLVIDEVTNFAHLKGTLKAFVDAFFEADFAMRLRPSYFPFTEPSAEVDIEWTRRDGSKGWLEVLGCGMVHPQVLRNCGVDPERYTGFAFGLGVERFAMLRYGISDLRSLFDNDLRLLRAFA